MIFLFPIGIFYLPETCLIYTQHHLATHSSPIWRRHGRGRGHRPGPGPRRTLGASKYHITFGYRFGFRIGFRFGESSPAQFGVLHLPLTYFFEVLFTHAILIKTKGTFALISLFSFQYIYKRFFHFYGFFDGWKTRRKKKTLKSLLAATRRVLCVEFCMLKFMLPDTPLCVTHTEPRAQQGRAHRALSSPYCVLFFSSAGESSPNWVRSEWESSVVDASTCEKALANERESFLCSAHVLVWRVGSCHCPGRALCGGGWASNAARHV